MNFERTLKNKTKICGLKNIEKIIQSLHPRRGAQCVNFKGNSAAPMYPRMEVPLVTT